jgi:hypothetical protein
MEKEQIEKIILDLKQKLYIFVNDNQGILIKDFKQLPEVIEIKTTIETLEKYYL